MASSDSRSEYPLHERVNPDDDFESDHPNPANAASYCKIQERVKDEMRSTKDTSLDDAPMTQSNLLFLVPMPRKRFW